MRLHGNLAVLSLLVLELMIQPLEVWSQTSSSRSPPPRRRRRRRTTDEKEAQARRPQRQAPPLQEEEKQNDNYVFYPVSKKRPSNIVEAAYGSLVVGGVAAAASTGALVGLPLWTWLQYTPPSNATTMMQYWKQKSQSIVLSILLGCVTSSMVVVVGTTIVVAKLIQGIWNTPKIVWEAGLQGRNYWNSTSAQWEHYHLENHGRNLEEMMMTGPSSMTVKDLSLYHLLNVKPSASAKEIKRAFHKLAKTHHPDKSSDPHSHAKFLQLHAAYETLYDPEKRRRYDKYGAAGSETETTELVDLGINVDIFFEILLGFSPKVEQYVGDLSIASFSRMLVEMTKVVTAASRLSGPEQQELFQRFASRAFFDAEGRNIPQMKTEKRQVDIALYLKSLVNQYVALAPQGKEVATSVFREVCKREALDLAESSPFAPFFLQSIGQTLYWECGQGSRWNLFGVMGTARRSKSRTKYWSRLIRQSWTLLRNFQRQYEFELENLGLFDGDAAGEDDDSNFARDALLHEARQRAFQSVLSLPSIMDDFVWPTIDMDISNTLQGACWKVLNDSSNDEVWKGGHRREQTVAFRILGQEFINLGKALVVDNVEMQVDDTHDDASESSKDRNTQFQKDAEEDLRHRIQVAVLMARTNQETKGSVFRESEEMIDDLRKQRSFWFG